MVKTTNQLMTKLEPYSVDLSTDERRRAVKMRPGGDGIVSLVGDLADERGVEVASAPVEGMRNDLELAERLVPLLVKVDALRRRIADTILEAQSEAWWAGMTYYTTLSRLSAGDPQLEAALKPAVQFFALGRRAPKTPAEPTQPVQPVAPSVKVG